MTLYGLVMYLVDICITRFVYFITGIKRKLSCRLCQKTYTNFKSLSKHEKEHEVSKVGEPVCKEQRTGKSKFKCSCCKITFHAKEECIVHQHNEHADLLSKTFIRMYFYW